MSTTKSRRMFAFAVTLMLTLAASLLFTVSVFEVAAQTTPTITVGSGTGYVNSTSVALTVSAVNATQMQFSNDATTWSNWEPYTTTKNWALTDGDGAKTVYAEFQDSSSQVTTASVQVTLDTVPPVPYPYYEWLSVENRLIAFDGSGSVDNSPIRFFWSFGDGDSAEVVSVNHTYTAIGNYSAYVTVTDIAGNAATQPFIVYVLERSAFATPTPTPAPTQHPTVAPTATPQVTTQPSTGSGFSLSAGWLIIIGAAVLLVVVVVLLVFVLKRTRRTVPKPV